MESFRYIDIITRYVETPRFCLGCRDSGACGGTNITKAGIAHSSNLVVIQSWPKSRHTHTSYLREECGDSAKASTVWIASTSTVWIGRYHINYLLGLTNE